MTRRDSSRRARDSSRAAWAPATMNPPSRAKKGGSATSNRSSLSESGPAAASPSVRPASAAKSSPGAGCRGRAVDHRKQAAAAFARQRLGQFQIAAGGSIYCHAPGLSLALERLQERVLALLGEIEIADKRAGGRQFGPAKRAKAVEHRDPVEGLEQPLAGLGIEITRRPCRQARAQFIRC